MTLDEAHALVEALACLRLQPRLPDPRLPGEDDKRSPIFDELAEDLLELRKLGLTSDERRRARLVRRLPLAGHPVGRGRRALPLQLELAERLQQEPVAELAGRLRAH